MHFGIVCPEMTGHLNPSLALGRELARGGHQVTVFTGPGARAKVGRAGLNFEPIGEGDEERVAAGLARLAEMRGMAATFHTGRMIREGAEVVARELPAALERSGVEGLIVDQVSPAAAVVADEIGLPYAVVCNALACYYDPTLPAPPLPWRYRPGRIWTLRNRLASKAMSLVFDRVTGVKRGGVSPLMLFFEFERGLTQVAQQPAFFDFPRSRLPEHFHYTGPWHEPARDDEIDFPWERLDGRALVYASLGTLQNRLRHVYAAITEATTGLDVQLVIALGNKNATLDLPPRENVIVVPYAPQLRLLERAAVAVTHAGLNTALECLSAGVPMVCLPVTNDQPGVARRVEWLGAGEVLSIRRVTPTRLRRLLGRILDEPNYRATAGRLRDEIAAADGLARAAEIIERALTRRERVCRPNAIEARQA
jgi:MGT family glycosyltransferase